MVVVLVWFDGDVELFNDVVLVEVKDFDVVYCFGIERLVLVFVGEFFFFCDGDVLVVVGLLWLVLLWLLVKGVGCFIVNEFGDSVVVGIEVLDYVVVVLLGCEG